jgi:hypothetical protein
MAKNIIRKIFPDYTKKRHKLYTLYPQYTKESVNDTVKELMDTKGFVDAATLDFYLRPMKYYYGLGRGKIKSKSELKEVM